MTPSTPRSRPLAVLRAAWQQAAADLRPVLLGAGVFNTLLSAGIILLVARMTSGDDDAGAAFGPMLVAGSVGAFGGLIALQMVSETYTDRVGGALLRVRILPHGPLVWAIGKSVSSLVQTALLQLTVLIGAALFVPALPLTVTHVLMCLPFIVLTAMASAPLGILAGSVVRGMYSLMFTMLAIMVPVVTSGSFFPIGVLPRWVQLIQMVLPTYWSGHLTRWALVGDPSWEMGGAFSPAVALTVLAAWTVIGYALVPLVITSAFRKESIGSLARMQSSVRSQSGL